MIRWGILGTGTAADAFTRGLKRVEGATVAAVGSRAAPTAQAFAARHGIGKAHGSYEALAGDADVDVVYIATPPVRHRDDCLLCINAGKAVVCEKPFAVTANEAREVVAAARSRGVFCMEAMWMRFMPLVQKAKALIDAGEIGPVRMLTADFALPARAEAGSRWLDPRHGGGALLDRGVYGVALACYLLGEPAAVQATSTMAETGADVQSAAMLRFAEGATALVWSSFQTRGSNEAVIMGQKGQLRLHEPFYRPHRLTIEAAAPPPPAGGAPGTDGGGFKRKLKESAVVQRVYRRLQPVLHRPALDLLQPIDGNGYSYEAREATRCVRDGLLESPLMPLDQTVRVMDVMDRIRDAWGRPQ
jgi:predicted dehydrogenase